MANDPALDGIYNLRDYGGWRTASGAQLRTGRLFRSGEHGDASDADVERVRMLGLKLVVDLRGASERAAMPCRRPPGFAARVIEANLETVDPSKHGMASGQPAGSAADGRLMMRRIYEDMPHNPVMIDLLSRFFQEMAEVDGSSLVHCAAGKDRTGFAVFLFHHAMGVHPDDAMADYLRSNTEPGREVWRRRSVARAAASGAVIADEMMDVFLSVDPELMSAACGSLLGRFGSLDRYLEEVLGVGEALRRRLHHQYLS